MATETCFPSLQYSFFSNDGTAITITEAVRHHGMDCAWHVFSCILLTSSFPVSKWWPLEPFRIFERSSFSPSRTVVVERKPASIYCLFFFATAFFLKPVSSVTPPIWLNGVDWTTTCQQYIFCWTFLLLLMTLAIVPFHRPPTLFLSFLCFSSIPHHHHNISGIHKIIQTYYEASTNAVANRRRASKKTRFKHFFLPLLRV